MIAMDIAEHYDAIAQCNKCGFCQVACPIFRSTGHESGVARGRLALLRALIEGRLEWNKELEEPFYDCLGCGACTANCFPAVPTADLVNKARAEYLEKVDRKPIHQMLFDYLLPYPRRLHLAARAVALLGSSVPLAAQTQKIGVIDVRRLVTDSLAGKEVLGELQTLSDSKAAELKQMADEMEALRTRITEGRLSLSQERLAELEKQFEDNRIAFGRARDDADRELQKMQGERFAAIENQIMPIINAVGTELGYTMIFNKYESGLVFAQESADITDVILQRFDSTFQAGAPAD